MLEIGYTSQFERDYKKYRNIQNLKVVLKLMSGKPLPARYKDYQLKSGKSECRECYLTPNILVFYRI
ncbi:MAG TPA: type II toxin-antitoxin system mRNA interferase toxin, RelE/StbE family [Candidatus Cloacimonas sp.]|nr:type II toxin-antitoxin system YafQ family toxin [Candidatus Cloacimonas sp.]MDD2251199.1 type II toxin-antitoxin system mRNA interferase toxin, RelE/StbE family [Candidatus Cloacimonadota bacterium]MDD3734006.1 type II toxin-antitoxin system mRNA interferase toxin, RelE/StbE family [Candidatus Cloacimonadota bacterium]MDD3869349.1 type II toxin-antitoxin system mRNA interferase toxin, RelE/StbE family [Candidatus Cloacimonadota bacterium]MDD4676720.1 type II toxin-antitoxin system mRNA inte